METLFTILVSAIITFLVTWYFTKKQMKNNEITHYSINCFDVGKGLHTDFPQFQIKYDGNEINNEVHVLKGGYVNTGRDLSDLKGENELSIILPESCKIKDIKVQESNSDVHVKFNKDEQKPNIIKFGIEKELMHDEGFNYTAIIETSEVFDNLRNELKYNKRIPRTDLKKENIGQGKQPKRLLRLGIFTGLSSLLFLLFSIYIIFQQPVKFTVYEKKTNKEVKLYTDVYSQIYISENNSFLPFLSRKAIGNDVFNEKYSVLPTKQELWKNEGFLTAIPLLLLILSYAYMSYDYTSKYFRRKHVISILKLSKGAKS